jgi:hypothetical protein
MSRSCRLPLSLASRKITENQKFFSAGKLDACQQGSVDSVAMKLTLFASAWGSCLLVTSCQDFSGPLSNDEFNPLMTPGARQGAAAAVAGNYNFTAGQYVTAASNSTALFHTKPTGNAEADELLAAGTSMRVIKSEGSFVKVELDNGKVGYVAAALLLESQHIVAPLDPSLNGGATSPLPAGMQTVVPPTDLGTGAPLPPIAPPAVNELPPSSLDSKKPESSPLPEPAETRE